MSRLGSYKLFVALELIACTLVNVMTFGWQRQRTISSDVHTISKGTTSCTTKQQMLRLKVNVIRMLGVPFAHGTADLVRGHPALVKPGRGEVFHEHAGQQHLVLLMFRFKTRLLTGSLLMSHNLARCT